MYEASLEKSSGADRGLLKRQSHHVTARRKLKFSSRLMPWDSVQQRRPQYRGISRVARPRVQDHINICWWKMRSTSTRSDKELMRDSFANVSQCVLRFPVSLGEAPCFTTSSYLYSFEHDRILSGASHLRGMGHPRSSMPLSVLPDSAARQLAGESFSVPLSCVIETTLSLNPFASWW